ncbi:hypothetical protein SKAU_G00343490 [Synaphobranchus kaupii]|uniref:Enhancer of mRNA-decapping protein 4 n=1 Tax=Synaphobranchus kaupii TaxID=118154 RepID=A0A9Q1EJ02_SYNKA|nr:hypothetical protein SKAU_G00343490 [Synaphobranchus kaupii]
MASNSNIDIEDATQHLRDILKLDRPGNSGDGPSVDSQKKASFNGELNGLFGADLLAASVQSHPELMEAQETQTILLSGDDSSTSIAISSNNVEIVASHDSSISSKARGSNKVKIQPVAKYDWEHKYYYGNLIAVSNAYLAYAIRGANSYAMIRVLSLATAERTLLKGFVGGVTDLAFAHLDSTQLACIDEAGNLFVWQLTSRDGKILDEVIVHIRRPEDTPLNSNRRLIWCPLHTGGERGEPRGGLPDSGPPSRGPGGVWDLDILRSNSSTWPVDATDVKDGFISVRGHSARISEGALSPDGTVLATASHDGYIKFWQIYIEGQDQPRCLHEWKPHNGKPLSCLLFCDNHKKQDPDVPFWRFLITGADQNRELKMWCTVSWTCLQTVRFSPDPFNSSVMPSLKASLDLSADYLILSDVQRKVLYVMELRQDQEKGRAGFTAVSEFLLTHPVLSFGIQDVSRSRLRHTEVLPPDEESESMATEGSQGPVESKAGVQIKLYCVHTKSLQDVQIWFQPQLGPGNTLILPQAGSQDDFGFSDHLTDVSVEGLGSDKESGRSSQNDHQGMPALPAPADFLSPISESKPKLMTPDAFMTPSASIPASPGSSASSLTVVTAMSSNSDSGGARGGDELIQSPKISLETSSSSITLSTTPSGSSRTSTILIPGLGDQMPVNQLQMPVNQLQVLSSPNPPPLPGPAGHPRNRLGHAAWRAGRGGGRGGGGVSRGHAARGQHGVGGVRPAPPLAAEQERLGPPARLALELGPSEGERLSSTPSLLETALSQESAAAAAACADGAVSQPWPAAPDITRETRNSLRDNSLVECCREGLKEKHKSSPYHRHAYSLPHNDSQDASAEQSDHDDEVASLASSSGNCGARSSHRLPVKDWKVSPRASPKLKRKSKKDDGDSSQSRHPDHQMNPELQEELLLLLRSQQRDIAELRQSQLDLLQRLTGHMDSVQSSLMAHVEQTLIGQQEQDQRRVDRMVAEGLDRNRQVQENFSQQLSQTLTNVLSNRLDKVLRDEMKKTVPQTISKSLEPITGQLSNTIAAKLTAVEGNTEGERHQGW